MEPNAVVVGYSIKKSPSDDYSPSTPIKNTKGQYLNNEYAIIGNEPVPQNPNYSVVKLPF